MSAINETVMLILDNTISCSVSPSELLLRTLALFGLLSIGGMVFSGLGKGIAYPIIYLYGSIKWIYNKFKGKTI